MSRDAPALLNDDLTSASLGAAAETSADVAPGSGTIYSIVAGGRSTDFATWILKRAFHFMATITRIALTPPLAEG